MAESVFVHLTFGRMPVYENAKIDRKKIYFDHYFSSFTLGINMKTSGGRTVPSSEQVWFVKVITYLCGLPA